MIAARKRSEGVSDAALLAAVAAGDLSGLGTLFDRYGADVRRLVARLGIAPGDLDDVVQETFLDLLSTAKRFDPSATSARPWIFGLAMVIVRRRRRTFARAFAFLQTWTREPTERPRTPAEEVETSSEAARAAAALERLAPKKREAFVLVVLEDMSCAEAALALDVPVATIWSRVHYARADLQALLAEGAR